MEGVYSYLLYMPILATMYLSTIYLMSKLQKRPPTPFLCLPVFGHLYTVKHPMSECYASLANRLGPIIFLWYGSRPTLLISSESAAEECLTKNDTIFCNRPSKTLAGVYRGFNYASITFAPYGHYWRNLRKISTIHILSSHRLQSIASVRAYETMLLIKRLCISPTVVELRSQLRDTNMNMTTRMLFGKRYYGVEENDEQAKRLREIVFESTALLEEQHVGDVVPYLRWLGWTSVRRFRGYQHRRDTLLNEFIEDHQIRRRESKLNSGNLHENKPVIQVLLELQESDPETYHNEVVRAILMDLLIGGLETSTNTMEWAMSLLLNHPNALRKVRAEIDHHVGYERFVEESDLNHLPYLQCILNETLRMYPPLPFLFPHESSEDCVVGGYRIPRGIFLMINIYAIQNDPKIWDSPDIFRPERFEGVQGHKIGYKMIPFGAGRRSCPGEGLAIRVMGMILATLIQCFDIERVDDMLVDMSKLPTFTLQKSEPLSVEIQPRQVMKNLLDKLYEAK